jgi:ADP-heptose:LPS heptosyltransferase
MPRLQIYDARERAMVGTADRLIAAAAAVARPFRRRRRPAAPARILVLRLERIGDLLMALPAIGDLRDAWPSAAIDLVVGSWNAPLAQAIRGVSRVQTLDAAWLARESTGRGLAGLLAAARVWRTERYDLALNFEPDIRSNLLLAASGAAWTAGYSTGGGGPLLDVALEYDPAAHTTANARRLVAAVAGDAVRTAARPMLDIGDRGAEHAERALAGAARPLVGVHASGGREIKQWPPERFADVARRLIAAHAATIVLTGSRADLPLVQRVAALLPPDRTIVAAGDADLLTTAAVLARLDLFVTGDTGPMHLAHATGTPIVAVFGPSDPARYAPTGPLDRVVRVDLPCARALHRPHARLPRPGHRGSGH